MIDKNLPVTIMNINSLIPFEKNVKIHDDKQINNLANNIRQFGFDQPIVVDANNVIIKGHGRRLACLKLGIENVPVIVRDDLTPEEVDAARLSDNRVVSNEYDIEGLQEELERLAGDFDFQSLGFDERELNFSINNIDIEQDEFVDNVTESIEKYDEETQEKLKEDKKISVVSALGFKYVSSADSFYINKFVEKAMSEYHQSLSPEAAFCRYVSELVEK